MTSQTFHKGPTTRNNRAHSLVTELFLPHDLTISMQGPMGAGEWRQTGVVPGMTVTATLEIRLYGPPQVSILRAQRQPLNGQRLIALIALLATGPGRRRTRTWLTDILWSDLPPERARANLRQLIYAMRSELGPQTDDVLEIERDAIGLREQAIQILGDARDGIFLEGFDLNAEGFEDWLRDMRLDTAPSIAATVRASQHLVPATDAISILPRITVLPFAEIPASPASGLGGALAHELTTHFARSQLIDAISYFSSQIISSIPQGTLNELDCEYALVGQCRQKNDVLVVDASLIDAPTGKVLWSDRQRTDLDAFLSGEDSLTAEIAGQSLRVIMSGAIGQSSSRPLPDLSAHILMMSAVALMHSFQQSQFERAQEQLNAVIDRCPEHSVPRAWLAQWHLLRVYQKWSPDAAKDSQNAQIAVNNALDLNANCPLALSIDGNIQTIFTSQYDTARNRFDAANAINPSSAFGTQLEAVFATFTGDGNRAVALTERAFRLSPRDPRRPFFMTLGAGSYVAGGRYAQAVEMAEESIRYNPLHLSAHRCRVIGLQLDGQEAAARVAARELMRLDPDMRVSSYQKDHPASQTSLVQTWAEALKNAGIPQN